MNINKCCICNNILINLITSCKFKMLCVSCFDRNKYIEYNGDKITKNNQQNFFMHNKKIYILKTQLKLLHRTSRKEILLKKISDMKLRFDSGSMCNSYIKFGVPDIDTVIESLFTKQNLENDRLFNLINSLRERNLEYNENIPSYKKYIKNGGNLEKIISDGEIEKVLVNESNYLSLYDDLSNDSDTAKDIALSNYIDVNGSNKLINDYILKKNTLYFE